MVHGGPLVAVALTFGIALSGCAGLDALTGKDEATGSLVRFVAIDLSSGSMMGMREPNDAADVLSLAKTRFEYTHAGGTNTGASYVYNVYPCGATNNGANLNCAAAALFTPQGANAAFGPGAWDRYLAAHPGAYAPGILAYLDEQKRIGPYKTNYIGGSKHQGNDWFVSNVTNFEANDNLTVRNIFGLSRSWYRSEQGGVGAGGRCVERAYIVALEVGADEAKGRERARDRRADDFVDA